MNLGNILTLIFGLATTVLGILLKGEYDKRMALQQQVSEHKRSAYAAFNETINSFLVGAKDTNQTKNAEQTVKQLIELRKEIWQYGSDDVIKAFAAWSQCNFAAKGDDNLSKATIILMADLIVKMRIDLGISRPNSITPLDILHIFLNDIELKYDGLTANAKKFRDSLHQAKHVHL